MNQKQERRATSLVSDAFDFSAMRYLNFFFVVGLLFINAANAQDGDIVLEFADLIAYVPVPGGERMIVAYKDKLNDESVLKKNPGALRWFSPGLPTPVRVLVPAPDGAGEKMSLQLTRP